MRNLRFIQVWIAIITNLVMCSDEIIFAPLGTLPGSNCIGVPLSVSNISIDVDGVARYVQSLTASLDAIPGTSVCITAGSASATQGINSISATLRDSYWSCPLTFNYDTGITSIRVTCNCNCPDSVQHRCVYGSSNANANDNAICAEISLNSVKGFCPTVTPPFFIDKGLHVLVSGNMMIDRTYRLMSVDTKCVYTAVIDVTVNNVTTTATFDGFSTKTSSSNGVNVTFLSSTTQLQQQNFQIGYSKTTPSSDFYVLTHDEWNSPGSHSLDKPGFYQLDRAMSLSTPTDAEIVNRLNPRLQSCLDDVCMFSQINVGPDLWMKANTHLHASTVMPGAYLLSGDKTYADGIAKLGWEFTTDTLAVSIDNANLDRLLVSQPATTQMYWDWYVSRRQTTLNVTSTQKRNYVLQQQSYDFLQTMGINESTYLSFFTNVTSCASFVPSALVVPLINSPYYIMSMDKQCYTVDLGWGPCDRRALITFSPEVAPCGFFMYINGTLVGSNYTQEGTSQFGVGYGTNNLIYKGQALTAAIGIGPVTIGSAPKQVNVTYGPLGTLIMYPSRQQVAGAGFQNYIDSQSKQMKFTDPNYNSGKPYQNVYLVPAPLLNKAKLTDPGFTSTHYPAIEIDYDNNPEPLDISIAFRQPIDLSSDSAIMGITLIVKNLVTGYVSVERAVCHVNVSTDWDWKCDDFTFAAPSPASNQILAHTYTSGMLYSVPLEQVVSPRVILPSTNGAMQILVQYLSSAITVIQTTAQPVIESATAISRGAINIVAHVDRGPAICYATATPDSLYLITTDTLTVDSSTITIRPATTRASGTVTAKVTCGLNVATYNVNVDFNITPYGSNSTLPPTTSSPYTGVSSFVGFGNLWDRFTQWCQDIFGNIGGTAVKYIITIIIGVLALYIGVRITVTVITRINPIAIFKNLYSKRMQSTKPKTN